MSSNNAVILREAHTYGKIEEGKTLVFEKRPYDLGELKDGEFVVKTMYLSVDPYLVNPHTLFFENTTTNCRGDVFVRRV
jgi:NADPH-dependent curcumin reductase CurA